MTADWKTIMMNFCIIIIIIFIIIIIMMVDLAGRRV